MDLNILKEKLEKYFENEKIEHEVKIENANDEKVLYNLDFFGMVADEYNFEYRLESYTYESDSTNIYIYLENYVNNTSEIFRIERNENVERLLDEYNFASFLTKAIIITFDDGSSALAFRYSFNIENEDETCRNFDEVITEMCGVEELYPLINELKKYCKPKN